MNPLLLQRATIFSIKSVLLLSIFPFLSFRGVAEKSIGFRSLALFEMTIIFCHFESGLPDEKSNSSAKSFSSKLIVLIKAIFFSFLQSLTFFSHSIASLIYPNSQKYINLVILYFNVNPGINLLLCSIILHSKLLVTPV